MRVSIRDSRASKWKQRGDKIQSWWVVWGLETLYRRYSTRKFLVRKFLASEMQAQTGEWKLIEGIAKNDYHRRMFCQQQSQLKWSLSNAAWLLVTNKWEAGWEPQSSIVSLALSVRGLEGSNRGSLIEARTRRAKKNNNSNDSSNSKWCHCESQAMMSVAH